MKAQIIAETVYEGFMDWSHGGGYTINRIVVPEANNLVITVHGENIYVWDNFQKEKREDYEVVKEIDIPDELIARLRGLMELHKSLVPQVSAYLYQ